MNEKHNPETILHMALDLQDLLERAASLDEVCGKPSDPEQLKNWLGASSGLRAGRPYPGSRPSVSNPAKRRCFLSFVCLFFCGLRIPRRDSTEILRFRQFPPFSLFAREDPEFSFVGRFS